MRIGALTRPRGDHPDLIQRQPALPHARRATRELLQPARDGGDRVRVRRRATHLPGHQRRHRPRTGDPAQLVALDLSHNLHQAPINRVALPGQLRHLLEQHLKTVAHGHHHGVISCDRRHNDIIAATTDKFRRHATRWSRTGISELPATSPPDRRRPTAAADEPPGAGRRAAAWCSPGAGAPVAATRTSAREALPRKES